MALKRRMRAFSPLQLRIRLLKYRAGARPGRTCIAGWRIGYLDAPSLSEMIRTHVLEGWNDFTPGRPDPLILDCGANIGISVLNFRRRIPGARIVAFEPDPAVYPVLLQNLHDNAVTGVEALNRAVWTEDGELPFYAPNERGRRGSRIDASQAEGGQHHVSVASIDFAAYLDGLDAPVDLLKMDIEGAEFDVIPHLEGHLGPVRSMLVECHVSSARMDRFVQLLNVLIRSGFHLAINSESAWISLRSKPGQAPSGRLHDHILLVAAWRPGE